LEQTEKGKSEEKKNSEVPKSRCAFPSREKKTEERGKGSAAIPAGVYHSTGVPGGKRRRRGERGVQQIISALLL